jgi:hypothetical protein
VAFCFGETITFALDQRRAKGVAQSASFFLLGRVSVRGRYCAAGTTATRTTLQSIFLLFCVLIFTFLPSMT